MITEKEINRAVSYEQYINLVEELVAQGKSTGADQSADYVYFNKLNLQRMLRLKKTFVLQPDLISALKQIKNHFVWVVLTEGWCGDAAQIIPVLAGITEECPNIQLKILLRDQNLELMDQYLSGNSRSIPKLICVEQKTLTEKFVWGPRPAEAQTLMLALKRQETPSSEKSLLIQKWYNADKTQSLQQELLLLIQLHQQ